MAITKDQKKELIKQYVADLNSASNTIIFSQTAISVPEATEIRKDLAPTEGKFNVVRKRLFLLALKEAGMDDIDPSVLDGSLAVVYAKGDEFGPLKVINKHLKAFKKSAETKNEISFLGGWFEKKRQDAEYVNELANIPSREELLSKLAWLFNYPLQSFASVLDQIAKKLGGGEGKVEEVKEVKEEVKEEAPAEEVPVEAPVEEKKEEVAPEASAEEAKPEEAKEEEKA